MPGFGFEHKRLVFPMRRRGRKELISACRVNSFARRVKRPARGALQPCGQRFLLHITELFALHAALKALAASP